MMNSWRETSNTITHSQDSVDSCDVWNVENSSITVLDKVLKNRQKKRSSRIDNKTNNSRSESVYEGREEDQNINQILLRESISENSKIL